MTTKSENHSGIWAQSYWVSERKNTSYKINASKSNFNTVKNNTDSIPNKNGYILVLSKAFNLFFANISLRLSLTFSSFFQYGLCWRMPGSSENFSAKVISLSSHVLIVLCSCSRSSNSLLPMERASMFMKGSCLFPYRVFLNSNLRLLISGLWSFLCWSLDAL